MSAVETIKIKSDGPKGFRVINRSSFDPKVHKPFDEKVGAPSLTPAEQKAADELDARRKAEANRGQAGNASPSDVATRNPSGTFSEPTPTDIRYPDKDATEFENNHGAFVGKSAAGLREEIGMPDAPGGIKPERSVGKGPKGLWFVMSNGERVSEGFKTEDEAKAALDQG